MRQSELRGFIIGLGRRVAPDIIELNPTAYLDSKTNNGLIIPTRRRTLEKLL